MSKIYGYCRASTSGQDIRRQEHNILSRYPNAEIIYEKHTGRNMNRPEWDKLCEVIKRGDTIVFDSVSRMSRCASSGFKTYITLYELGVNLVFLNEPDINTGAYRALIDNVNTRIFSVFEQAEKEANDICRRTQEGKVIARKNPNYHEGRPKKYTRCQLDHAIELLTDHSYTQVAEMTGISKSTLIREHKARCVNN